MIDTRADVYGLGVLLYELLTGETPVDRRQLERAALDEARRMIRELEPPKPSTRVSALGKQAVTICQGRQTNPPKLSRLLSGDLDWIVMKALDKDRTRRYGTTSELADDVTRYLNSEEVTARPPSQLYRLSKFARRNRTTVAMVGLAFLLLIATSAFGLAGYMVYKGKFIESQQETARTIAAAAATKTKHGDHQAAITLLQRLVDTHRSIYGAKALETLQSQTLLAESRAKADEYHEANRLFKETLAALQQINDLEPEQLSLAAHKYRAALATSVFSLLASDTRSDDDVQLALHFSRRAQAITDQYELKPNAHVFKAAALAQYEAREYAKVITTCTTWLSSKARTEVYLIYLYLAAASARSDQPATARDWLAAADNRWIGAAVDSRTSSKRLRDHVVQLLASAENTPIVDLSIEEEEQLYRRLLARAPGTHGLRRYLGYCLIQLGKWQEADGQFSILIENGESSTYPVACNALMDLYYDRAATSPTRNTELKALAITQRHWEKATLTIVAMLGDRDGELVDESFYAATHSNQIAGALVAYRLRKFDEAQLFLDTHSGAFPARNTLAAIINALLQWERGEKPEARTALSRAEATIARLAPSPGVTHTDQHVSYYTSVIWLEPILLLREARLKIVPDSQTE